jgi:hypothetical protein
MPQKAQIAKLRCCLRQHEPKKLPEKLLIVAE